MIIYQGKGMNDGLAVGNVRVVESTPDSVHNDITYLPEEEAERFQNALTKAIENLEDLAKHLRNNQEEVSAQLMEMHAEMVQDPDYVEAIMIRILHKGQSASAAVKETGEEFAGFFEAMEQEELQARSADIRDVSNRIAGIICGKTGSSIDSTPSILCARDLSPSMAASLDKSSVLAVVIQNGSTSGHMAIILRSLGIPAVTCSEIDLSLIHDGDPMIVDAKEGRVIVEPDKELLHVYQGLLREYSCQKEALKVFVHKETITKSGRKIRLCCNIQSPKDISSVKEFGGEGIGLFRSEFLFLGRNELPSEEEQYQAYRDVLEKMNDREVIIRTMDIGADKPLSYLSLPKEENPALGLRGLRLCLANEGLFREQLRALYRASSFGNLGIMFPMVANVWELLEAKRICIEVKNELIIKGISVADYVPVGVMIETPSAALMSEELAKEADFFSIGTNDLTQYTLACDRVGSHLQKYYDAAHPAVLRLMKTAVNSAHKEGIWVGVCGEMASNPTLTEELVNMGVDELSVPPECVLSIRKTINEIG